MMKRIVLAAFLALCLVMMCGCSAVEEALGRIGDEMEASQVTTSKGSTQGMDWSFVPVVRDMAVKTFTDGFPEAKVTQTGVASKNGTDERVIVTLEYDLNGKTGSYGFDYEKNEAGEYILKRYGDGVSSDDL